MKLLSTEEMSQLERAFIFYSGLSREQFAVNRWGFPFIPIPTGKVVDGKHRLAPVEVNDEMLGHPIYWIDPKLTEWDTSEEPEERWCIRMFYLIMSFGLWGKKNSRQWINYIELQQAQLGVGETLDDNDYKAYRNSTVPKTKFDRFSILGEDDMRIPLSQWYKDFEDTIRQCSQILEESAVEFFGQQATALENVTDIFGQDADMRHPELKATNHGGWWIREIHPKLTALDRAYEEAMLESRSIAEIGSQLEDLINEVVEKMNVMEQSIAVLMVPVMRTAVTESEAFSEMLTYYRIGVQESMRQRSRWNYDDILVELFTEYPEFRGDNKPTLNRLMNALYVDYEKVWKRLRLAAYSYEALRSEDVPVVTYDELVSLLTASYDGGVREEERAGKHRAVDAEDHNERVMESLVDGKLDRLGVGQHGERRDIDGTPLEAIGDDDDDLYDALNRKGKSV